MEDVINLARYPIDRPGSPDWWRLVDDCRAELDRDGLFNLPGFLRQEALARAVAEVMPVIDRGAFVHARAHNIYFENRIEDLPDTHPALTRFRTSNRTICSDQMDGALVIRLYEWPPFARFLAAAMDIPRLWTMDDPLARVNVMSYGDAQALNWHFDRSEFTTTLLLQAPRIRRRLRICQGPALRRRPDPADARELLSRVPQPPGARELGWHDANPLGERGHATRPGNQP